MAKVTLTAAWPESNFPLNFTTLGTASAFCPAMGGDRATALDCEKPREEAGKVSTKRKMDVPIARIGDYCPVKFSGDCRTDRDERHLHCKPASLPAKRSLRRFLANLLRKIHSGNKNRALENNKHPTPAQVADRSPRSPCHRPSALAPPPRFPGRTGASPSMPSAFPTAQPPLHRSSR